MSPAFLLVVRTLHVLSAIALVGGVFARQIVRGEAARSPDVQRFAALSAGAQRLERILVIPGSLATVVLGILLGLLTDAPILGFLQGADRNWLLVSNLLLLSMALLPGVVFLPQRRRQESALADALQRGQFTDHLTGTLQEPATRFWHFYEQIAVVLVVMLMSLKPF